MFSLQMGKMVVYCFCMTMAKERKHMGKLIVFEGTDGSGKATQTELLCQALETQGVPFRRLSFPRYQE